MSYAKDLDRPVMDTGSEIKKIAYLSDSTGNPDTWAYVSSSNTKDTDWIPINGGVVTKETTITPTGEECFRLDVPAQGDGAELIVDIPTFVTDEVERIPTNGIKFKLLNAVKCKVQVLRIDNDAVIAEEEYDAKTQPIFDAYSFLFNLPSDYRFESQLKFLVLTDFQTCGRLGIVCKLSSQEALGYLALIPYQQPCLLSLIMSLVALQMVYTQFKTMEHC